jgi:secreted trypsin-like serine protease
MVSFRMPTGNHLFCGGVIITRWHILTAAHCLIDKQEYHLIIKIFMGRNSSWDTSEPHYEISHTTFHPNYKPANSNSGSFNDIAVVKVYKTFYKIIKGN